MLVNGKNYFNEGSFKEICNLLERGHSVEVYIDCIGHTRNNCEQENYRRALVGKYHREIDIKLHEGAYSYYYEYKLKGDGNCENNQRER